MTRSVLWNCGVEGERRDVAVSGECAGASAAADGEPLASSARNCGAFRGLPSG